MRKAADLLKKLIVQIDTGNIVGKVEDLLLDPAQDRLAALITMSGRWLREAALIPWERIVICTGDVILVTADTEPQPASALPQLQQLLERNIHVSGTRVLTASGEKVGTVGEMLIDGEGQIKGYTISRGFLGAERQFVAAEDVEALGSGALIVRDNTTRDSLDDEDLPRDDLRPAIVMPITGTRIPAPLPPPPAPLAEAHRPDVVAYTGPTIFIERSDEAVADADSAFVALPAETQLLPALPEIEQPIMLEDGPAATEPIMLEDAPSAAEPIMLEDRLAAAEPIIVEDGLSAAEPILPAAEPDAAAPAAANDVPAA